jgi:hypothetical protein
VLTPPRSRSADQFLELEYPKGGHRIGIEKCFLLQSPLTESNRRPSPYHRQPVRPRNRRRGSEQARRWLTHAVTSYGERSLAGFCPPNLPPGFRYRGSASTQFVTCRTDVSDSVTEPMGTPTPTPPFAGREGSSPFAMATGNRAGFAAVGHLELFEDMCHVDARRLLCDEQGLGDPPVGEALGQEFEHLAFTRREAGRFPGRG